MFRLHQPALGAHSRGLPTSNECDFHCCSLHAGSATHKTVATSPIQVRIQIQVKYKYTRGQKYKCTAIFVPYFSLLCHHLDYKREKLKRIHLWSAEFQQSQELFWNFPADNIKQAWQWYFEPFCATDCIILIGLGATISFSIWVNRFFCLFVLLSVYPCLSLVGAWCWCQASHNRPLLPPRRHTLLLSAQLPIPITIPTIVKIKIARDQPHQSKWVAKNKLNSRSIAE